MFPVSAPGIPTELVVVGFGGPDELVPVEITDPH